MDILTQLLLGLGSFTLGVVVGLFIGIMMFLIGDAIKERRQARERDERRD